MKSVGVYGGSFNPVSKSHIEIGNQLIEKNYVDEVWYLPCYKSLHGKDLVNGDIRARMLQDAIDEEGCPELKVWTWELDNKASGRTIDVIKQILKDKDDNITYYFIIGMDNAENFDKFQEWEQVVSLVPFIIINRIGCESNQNWYKKEPHIFAEDINVPGMSSSIIRDALKYMETKGLPSEFFNWCSPWVFAIIHEQGLYGVYKRKD